MLTNKTDYVIRSGGKAFAQDFVNDDITMTVFNELNKTDKLLLKELKRMRRGNSFRFIVAAGAIYYIYKILNERLNKLEKTEETKEPTE